MDPAAIGALLSGFASLLAALWSMKGVKQRAKDECDERVSDIREAFKTGTKFERRAAFRDEEERRQAG